MAKETESCTSSDWVHSKGKTRQRNINLLGVCYSKSSFIKLLLAHSLNHPILLPTQFKVVSKHKRKLTTTHMLHVWNIYLHLPQKWPSFVGKYTSTMEHMGNANSG
jgi:hypothetical protein